MSDGEFIDISTYPLDVGSTRRKQWIQTNSTLKMSIIAPRQMIANRFHRMLSIVGAWIMSHASFYNRTTCPIISHNGYEPSRHRSHTRCMRSCAVSVPSGSWYVFAWCVMAKARRDDHGIVKFYESHSLAMIMCIVVCSEQCVFIKTEMNVNFFNLPHEGSKAWHCLSVKWVNLYVHFCSTYAQKMSSARVWTRVDDRGIIREHWFTHLIISGSRRYETDVCVRRTCLPTAPHHD